MKYLNYLGRKITNDARCTPEIISRSVMAKVIFHKIKAFFTNKLDFNLRNKRANVSTLYGAETWTLRGIDHKCLVSFKCGAGEGWK
jgi:hypothetical protein